MHGGGRSVIRERNIIQGLPVMYLPGASNLFYAEIGVGQIII